MMTLQYFLHAAIFFKILVITPVVGKQKMHQAWANVFQDIVNSSLRHSSRQPIDMWPGGIMENNSHLQVSISKIGV